MKLVFKKEIESTNIWGKKNIDYIEDKSVIYTDFQTAGRGRLGRKWQSFDSKNLYASIILKPPGDFSKLPIANLTQLLSVNIVDTLSEYNIKSYIKWPNDVIVDLNEDKVTGKKICGILAETVTISNKIKGVVIGFGLNINATSEETSKIDRPASSMFIETGKTYNTEEILKNICDKFFKNYDNFMETGFKAIKDNYKSKTEIIGKQITINMPHKSMQGTVHDINDNGAVLLKVNNDIITITMGEIQ